MQLDLGNARAPRPIGLAVGPDVAQQIGHRRRPHLPRRSQGQAADRTHLLLELARHAGVEREVPRVVRTRRDLVDEQPAVGRQEELDAQHADVDELLHDGVRDLAPLRRQCVRVDTRRRHRDVEDVVAMHVLDRTVVRERAVEPARGDHRHFVRELDDAFDDDFLVADQAPERARASSIDVQPMLAFAVVAKGGGLDDGRDADPAEGNARARRASGRRRTAWPETRDPRETPFLARAAA